MRVLGALIRWTLAIVFLPFAFPIALLSRLARRHVDVGLGPEPLVNNIYHKRALALYGYSAETFVDQVYYITSEFDIRADLLLPRPFGFLRAYYLFLRAVWRYRMLYIYFNGGPLMNQPMLRRLEPALYKTAGVKVLVMPYGGDVQDMTRSRNLAFKNALAVDYPGHRLRRKRTAQQIDTWTRWADHVISGVEWVDYMYHWDTLMLGHFSIDTSRWEPSTASRVEGPLRVLHAPNHRAIKGTEHFLRAVEQLASEGVPIEMVLLERASNDEVREAMRGADIVADQLIVGWYAMFALEAMAMGKPVLCYLRPDLIELYESVGLVEPDEIPIVQCSPATVKAALRALADGRADLEAIGKRGRGYVAKHHSLEVIGGVFARVNDALGVEPSLSAKAS